MYGGMTSIGICIFFPIFAIFCLVLTCPMP